MKSLVRSEVVGKRVVEIAIARPDKPVTMSDQSYSNGFLRLENGIWIDLDSQDGACAADPARLAALQRDLGHENTFQSIIDQKIADLVVSDDYPGICALFEDGSVVAIVP